MKLYPGTETKIMLILNQGLRQTHLNVWDPHLQHGLDGLL